MFGFVSHKGAIKTALLSAGSVWEQRGQLHGPVLRMHSRARGGFLSYCVVTSAALWGG